ncbi:MAG: hypothetical protein FIA97_04490 [Methylococcaceae bacterium]|nr:hypothetical protein [Methylococcaceae bacterium]
MIRSSYRCAIVQAVHVLGLLGLLCGNAGAATNQRDPFNGRQTYSGSAMNCLIANDFYAVHFTALQEGRKAGEKTDFEKYCQEIPSTGRIYLSVDLLDRDVRSTPIALRVVEESVFEDGRPSETKSTLAETSPKIYKNGTADTQVAVSQPGHYALIVTVGDGPITEDDQLRIPFSVALPPATNYSKLAGKLTGGLALAFYLVMAAIGYRVYRIYRPKKANPVPVEADASANART